LFETALTRDLAFGLFNDDEAIRLGLAAGIILGEGEQGCGQRSFWRPTTNGRAPNDAPLARENAPHFNSEAEAATCSRMFVRAKARESLETKCFFASELAAALSPWRRPIS
jgi:hypothetical protein